MKTDMKSIVLDLIVEGLCMKQFYQGLQAMGIRTEQEVSNQPIVAILLGVNIEHIPNAWLNEYVRWYPKATLLSYHDRRALRVLAENCLERLVLLRR